MSSNSSRGSLLNRRLIIFLAAMVFAELSRTMTMIQIPVYLRELGASIQQIGFFFTISLAFPLLLRIFGGWLSDTVGRLPALIVGSAIGVLTFIAYILAPSWQIALLGPAILAISSALIFPSYKSYIADHAIEEVRGRAFGIAEAVVTSAWIIGPPIGGYFAQNFGYRLMFLAAAVTFGIAMMVFFFLHRTAPSEEKFTGQKPDLTNLRVSFRQMFLLIISGGLVTWILIVDGVRDIAFKMSFDLMPIYLNEIALFSKQEIGYLDGLFGIALAATTIPAGWLADKSSERVGITLGIFTMIISRLVFAISLSFTGFAFSWMLLGVGGGLLDPAGSALIAKGIPKRMRGLAYGLIATSLGIFSLPAPWIGSQVWNYVNPRAPFLLSVVLGMIVIIPAWKKLVFKPKHWVGVEVTLP
ncbi:MAG: MFS transporter [Chloroflexi bacterium]|nr:MFS transporter [Chloroflexota bacterium]